MSTKERNINQSRETREFGQETFTLEIYPDFLSLDEQERQNIAMELVPLTAEGFMRFQIDDEITQDVLAHVATAPRLRLLRNSEGQAVMFIASAVIDLENFPVYYLGGIIVSSSLQGLKDKNGVSIAQSLLEEDINSTNAILLALQTQNERMRTLASKVSTLSEELTQQLIAIIRPDLQLDGDVNRKVYRNGYCLYDDIERFDKIAIKDEGFNYLEGDAKFLMGYLKTSGYDAQ